VIYLADCPFRIPRFTHHSADLSAYWIPHFTFRIPQFRILPITEIYRRLCCPHQPPKQLYSLWKKVKCTMWLAVNTLWHCHAGCWRMLDVCMNKSQKDLYLGPLQCFVTPH